MAWEVPSTRSNSSSVSWVTVFFRRDKAHGKSLRGPWAPAYLPSPPGQALPGQIPTSVSFSNRPQSTHPFMNVPVAFSGLDVSIKITTVLRKQPGM